MKIRDTSFLLVYTIFLTMVLVLYIFGIDIINYNQIIFGASVSGCIISIIDLISQKNKIDKKFRHKVFFLFDKLTEEKNKIEKDILKKYGKIAKEKYDFFVAKLREEKFEQLFILSREDANAALNSINKLELNKKDKEFLVDIIFMQEDDDDIGDLNQLNDTMKSIEKKNKKILNVLIILSLAFFMFVLPIINLPLEGSTINKINNICTIMAFNCIFFSRFFSYTYKQKDLKELKKKAKELKSICR